MSDETLDQHLARMQHYYSQRAPEYEAIYYRPDGDRKRELDALIEACREWYAGRRVLEVACGTAFWTHAIADVVASVVATDGSEDMLSLARKKPIAPGKAEFRIADAYTLDNVTGPFDAAMANFWISHVPKRRLAGFLENLHVKLEPGARVMMMDNVGMPGVGGELKRFDGIDDEFRVRELADGSKHLVLKNYYEADDLLAVYSPYAKDLRVEVWKYYWMVAYTVR